MPTREEVIRAARRQAIIDEAMALPPTLAPAPPPSPVEPLELPQDRRARVLREARELATESTAAQGAGVLPAPVVERREQELVDVLTEEAERRRGAVLSTGRVAPTVEPAPGAATSAVPFLRPSRIRPVRGQQMYVEPDTGVVRPPSDLERLVESFARQQITPERTILRDAIERAEMPPERREQMLADLARVPESELGAGEVEGALSAALTPLSVAPAVVREAAFGPAARRAREAVEGTLARAIGADAAANVVNAVPSLAILGARQVDRPAELERGETAIGRVGDILASRESIGDEFARTPAIVDRLRLGGLLSEEAAKDAAWALGVASEMAVPIAPGVSVAGSAVRGAGRAVGKVAPKLDVDLVPAMLRRVGLEDAAIVAGTGMNADAAIARKAFDAALQATDLTDAQRATIRQVAMPKVVWEATRTRTEESARILEDAVESGIKAAGNVRPDVADGLVAAARRAIPLSEPMVRIVPDVAVPRSLAPAIRKRMDDILRADPAARPAAIRAEVEATMRGLSPAEVVSEVADRIATVRKTAALAAAGAVGRNATDLRVAELAADDALRGGILARAFPTVAESATLRRMAMLDPRSPTVAAASTAARVRQAAVVETRRVMDALRAAPTVQRGIDDVLREFPSEAREAWPAIRSKILGDLAESVGSRVPDPATIDTASIYRWVEAVRATGVGSSIPGGLSRDATTRAIVAGILEDVVGRRVGGIQQPYREFAAQFGMSALDRQVAQSADALAKSYDELPVPRQVALAPFVRESTLSWAERQARMARQAVRYGLPVVPNIPYLGVRAVTGMALPFVTVGVRAAIGGAYRAPGIGSIDTVLGRLTPAETVALAERYGVGLTAVDAERVGMLADTLYRSIGAGTVARGLAAFRDAVPNIARSIEHGYRVGVFRYGLSTGLSPEDAATLARRSQVDWDALVRDPTTGPALEVAMRFLPASVETAAATAEVLGATARNPAALVAALRGQTIANREIAERNGIPASDAVLSSVPVPLDILSPDAGPLPLESASATEMRRQGLMFMAPSSPLLMPVEAAVGTVASLATAGDMVADLRDMATDGRLRGDWADRVAGALLRLPGLFAGRDARTIVASDARRPTDEEVYAGTVILTVSGDALAAGSDPHAGQVASAVLAILRPVPVLPPGTDPGTAPSLALWTTMPPPGLYIVPATDARTGKPGWMAFRPSDEGLANLRAIRSLTPDAVESIATSALYGPATAVVGPPATTSPERTARARVEAVREARR
jgi:hypothetical protein